MVKPPIQRIDRIRSGEMDALAEAFGDYRPRLGMIATFRLNSRVTGRIDIDDVLQEAYIRAADRCSYVEGDSEQSLFIWLRLILVQTITDLHREHLGAQKRNADLEAGRFNQQDATTISLAQFLIASITSPSQAFHRVELEQRLQQALDAMNETDREIIAMRHYEQLTNQEVAEALQLQQKAASIRYIRALKRLKTILDETTGITQLPD